MENPGTQVPFQSDKKLILRVAGDLKLLGTDTTDLTVMTGNPQSLQVNEEGNLVQVVSHQDAWVRVPAGADVRVEHVGGDAMISGLTGTVEVSFVGGDLKHNGAEKVDIGQVGGDLMASGVTGTLTVRRVGGEFGCDISGNVSVEMVGGDSNLRVKGGARLRSGGDILIRVDATSGEEVVLKAGGDIVLSLAAEMNAQLDLTSGGRDIALLIKDKAEGYEQPNVAITLGTGERNIRARAGGDIRVTDKPSEVRNLGDEFAQFEQEFSSNQVHEHHHGHHHEPKKWTDFEERIRKRTYEATRRAEERVRAAMDRVERENQRRDRAFGRKMGKHFGFTFGPDFPTPPEPPSPPEAPNFNFPGAGMETPAPAAETPVVEDYETVSNVTNEERMLVLKMLQEHKITVEEAEQLLAELEGLFD